MAKETPKTYKLRFESSEVAVFGFMVSSIYSSKARLDGQLEAYLAKNLINQFLEHSQATDEGGRSFMIPEAGLEFELKPEEFKILKNLIVHAQFPAATLAQNRDGFIIDQIFSKFDELDE